MSDADLPPASVQVLATMRRLQGIHSGVGLRALTGLSRNTVGRALRQLTSRGYLQVQGRCTSRRWSLTGYTIDAPA